MSAVTEMQVSVRRPESGEVALSQSEIEIGVRNGVIPVISMVTKVRLTSASKTLHIRPVIA